MASMGMLYLCHIAAWPPYLIRTLPFSPPMDPAVGRNGGMISIDNGMKNSTVMNNSHPLHPKDHERTARIPFPKDHQLRIPHRRIRSNFQTALKALCLRLSSPIRLCQDSSSIPPLLKQQHYIKYYSVSTSPNSSVIICIRTQKLSYFSSPLLNIGCKLFKHIANLNVL